MASAASHISNKNTVRGAPSQSSDNGDDSDTMDSNNALELSVSQESSNEEDDTSKGSNENQHEDADDATIVAKLMTTLNDAVHSPQHQSDKKESRIHLTNWDDHKSINKYFPPKKYDTKKYGQLRPPRFMLQQYDNECPHQKARAVNQWRNFSPVEQKILKKEFTRLAAEYRTNVKAIMKEKRVRNKMAKVERLEKEKEEHKRRKAELSEVRKKARYERKRVKAKENHAAGKMVCVFFFFHLIFSQYILP